MLEALAEELRIAEDSRTPVAPLSARHPELTVADAYAIQTINTRARGARVVGHKIGLTSKPMQEQLGIDQPDYGAVFETHVHRSGATLRMDDYIAARIEPELAFVLGRDLAPGDDVLAATEAIVPSLEVIDSRIADWKIGLIDTIADNASGAAIVLGDQRTPPADVALADAAVALSVDGEVVDRGTGAAVLGDPVRAVAWLAAALAEQGTALEAGHVVMSGSITAAVWLRPGGTVEADFGPLGTVRVTVR